MIASLFLAGANILWEETIHESGPDISSSDT